MNIFWQVHPAILAAIIGVKMHKFHLTKIKQGFFWGLILATSWSLFTMDQSSGEGTPLATPIMVNPDHEGLVYPIPCRLLRIELASIEARAEKKTLPPYFEPETPPTPPVAGARGSAAYERAQATVHYKLPTGSQNPKEYFDIGNIQLIMAREATDPARREKRFTLASAFFLKSALLLIAHHERSEARKSFQKAQAAHAQLALPIDCDLSKELESIERKFHCKSTPR